MSKSIPKWLTSTSYSLSSRPKLKIDDLEDNGSVFDTLKRRPSQRFKAIKQSAKKLKEAEEWIEYIKIKKGIS